MVRGKKGSGLPLRIPAMDLIEIGAGGGSIADVDPLGLLRVGPTSAGAEPGPACYGRGGKRPTVTDADLLLGYLAADRFLGGAMRLDVDAARAAVQGLADALRLSPIEAAAGVHRIVNENMANAIRVHIREKGHDPRASRSSPSAAPAPSTPTASPAPRRLQVIVPPGAGVTAALGFLTAAIATDHVRSTSPRWTGRTGAGRRACSPRWSGRPRSASRRRGSPGATRCSSAPPTCATPARASRSRAPARGRLDACRAAAIARAFLAVYRERYGQATRDRR